jgi:hypothetical protein
MEYIFKSSPLRLGKHLLPQDAFKVWLEYDLHNSMQEREFDGFSRLRVNYLGGQVVLHQLRSQFIHAANRAKQRINQSPIFHIPTCCCWEKHLGFYPLR